MFINILLISLCLSVAQATDLSSLGIDIEYPNATVADVSPITDGIFPEEIDCGKKYNDFEDTSIFSPWSLKSPGFDFGQSNYAPGSK